MKKETLFMILAIPIAVVAVALFLYLTAIQSPSSTVDYTPSIEIAGNQKLKDFTLIDQYGREFRLSSVKGKVVLLYFGYTNCPDVCPLVMSKYAYLAEKLGPDIEKVAMILITTDPERDSPEVLREYVERYTPRIIALTGPREVLERVWYDYGIAAKAEKPQEEGGQYFVAHTALVIVADKNMVMRFAFTPEMPPEEYLQGVKYLLSQ